MKAAVFYGKQDLRIEEIAMPEVKAGEVLVKVHACGICGTDVHEWKMDPFGLMPVVLGHEGTGEVVYCGKNIKSDTAGKSLKVGDKIVTSNVSDKYLPGILIGYISSINVDSNNLTKSGTLIPAADFRALREVLIITDLKQTRENED